MVLVPAIDMQKGQCVRLYKGDFEKTTVYGDPVEIARKWKDLGAKRIHLVDLDGAYRGDTTHLKIVEAIVNEVDVPLELGGGIRDMETITRYLEMGVDRVILGTAAVENMALVALVQGLSMDNEL